MQLALLFLVVV